MKNTTCLMKYNAFVQGSNDAWSLFVQLLVSVHFKLGVSAFLSDFFVSADRLALSLGHVTSHFRIFSILFFIFIFHHIPNTTYSIVLPRLRLSASCQPTAEPII